MVTNAIHNIAKTAHSRALVTISCPCGEDGAVFMVPKMLVFVLKSALPEAVKPGLAQRMIPHLQPHLTGFPERAARTKYLRGQSPRACQSTQFSARCDHLVTMPESTRGLNPLHGQQEKEGKDARDPRR